MWLEIIITSKIRIFSFIICRPDSFIYVAIWQTKSIIWYDDHVLVDVCGRICLTKKRLWSLMTQCTLQRQSTYRMLHSH